MIAIQPLAGGEEHARRRLERVPQRVTEAIVAQVALHRGDTRALLRIELGPEPVTRQRVALVGIEEAGAVRSRDDERQVHHPTVDRHRAVVVMDVAKLLQLLDDAEGVVDDEATDVGELEPEVAAQVGFAIVRRDVCVLARRELVAPHLEHVTDVERAIVGEVQLHLVVHELVADGERIGAMRHRLLAVRRLHLAPPDVDVVVVRGAFGEAAAAVAEDAEVLVHRVAGVGRVPDGDEVAGHGRDIARLSCVTMSSRIDWGATTSASGPY